ncbi:hypothetical protein GCM10027266_18960 [Arenimonas alkanexedens]
MAGRKYQQRQRIGGRKAGVALGIEHPSEPAFGQLEHVVFVVIVVRVVAKGTMPQTQPGQAQQGRIEMARVASAVGDSRHHGFEPGRDVGAMRRQQASGSADIGQRVFDGVRTV